MQLTGESTMSERKVNLFIRYNEVILRIVLVTMKFDIHRLMETRLSFGNPAGAAKSG